jgi:exodeoxyribonuclease V beta subunit
MSALPLQVFECELSGVSLIEASAGTGKTWNICALYLRLLLQRGLEVGQILVVTFTTAATAELRYRIRNRIAETRSHLRGGMPTGDDDFVERLLTRLRADPDCTDDRIATRLERALQCFDEAAIFTIHGFCERALRDTPLGAGMPLSMEILTDESALLAGVAADFWRRRIASGPLPPGLASYILEQKDTPDALAALLGRRVAKPLAMLRWPEDLDQAAAPDMGALQRAFDLARDCWQRDRAAIVGGVSEALGSLNANQYKPATLEQAARDWEAYLAGANPLWEPGTGDKLHLLTGGKLRPKAGKPPPAHHAFHDLAQALLEQRGQARAALSLCRTRVLRELLAAGPDALRSAKRSRRVMSFDDLLYNLHERLTNGRYPWLAPLLRSRFPAALIDEFQDTDPLQLRIFQQIHAGTDAALFLVGDPKQAIYSFRNADLRVYLRARREAKRLYTLVHNQRCAQPLLRGLNALFGSREGLFMVEGLPYVQLDYGARPRKALVDRTLARAPLQLWSLSPPAGQALSAKSVARRRSAQGCAAEIARLVTAGQRGDITQGGEHLGAGDIAVLVRTHREGQMMREALAGFGLGSVELSRAGIFGSAEALELERILAAILEPRRTPLLRAACSTVLLGGDAASLEVLAADDEALLHKSAQFSAYRDEWLRRGVGVMLRLLMRDEGIAARLLSLPFGERRLTNLLHLAESLQQSGAHQATPEVLLAWLQAHIAADAPDEAAQLRLESERNLVQIITIHRAKGLEYPIVFCPFLWDGSAGRADTHKYAREYHDAAGELVLDFRELSGEEERQISAQIRADRLAERLRLIYVALTRAVHRCYVVVGSYSTHTASLAECRHGALPWLVAGAGHAPAQWPENELEATALDAAWAALAARFAPDIGLAALPLQTGAAAVQRSAIGEAIVVREPPAHISPGWRAGSYSQLIYGASSEAAVVDHDLRAITQDSGVPERIAADDILRFPRGMTAGHCIHAVFESADFVNPAGWAGAIAAALRAWPQLSRQGGAGEPLPAMLANMLSDVLATPMPGGFRLADVPRARRLTELNFSMPVSRLTQQGLGQVLRQYGAAMPGLTFPALEGYLNGAVDLVVEAAGRFWIVDWKSNYLGASAAHYGAAALRGAMDQHHYHLQYLIYTVALHRYLEQRLPGYTYADHLGGVLYLFVRGVRPGWVNADGYPAGVYAARPAEGLVRDLSALLRAARDAA